MKSLSKATIKERDEIIDKFRDRFTDLEQAVDAYNSALESLWTPIADALQSFNEVIDDANAWKRQIVEEIGEYIGDRSDKWQESDRGREYQAWQDEFDSEWDGISLDKAEELDLSQIENYEELMENFREDLSE